MRNKIKISSFHLIYNKNKYCPGFHYYQYAQHNLISSKLEKKNAKKSALSKIDDNLFIIRLTRNTFVNLQLYSRCIFKHTHLAKQTTFLCYEAKVLTRKSNKELVFQVCQKHAYISSNMHKHRRSGRCPLALPSCIIPTKTKVLLYYPYQLRVQIRPMSMEISWLQLSATTL